MAVPNRKAVIEAIAAKFAAQIVAPADQIDGIGRRLLPHCIEAMPAEERSQWGVLRKSTGTFPYDILVWRPTREHLDVWTSKEVSPGVRRLIATWGNAGVLPRPDWTWCDWRLSGIIPLETGEPPSTDPPPPVEDSDIPRQISDLRAAVTALQNWIKRPL